MSAPICGRGKRRTSTAERGRGLLLIGGLAVLAWMSASGAGAQTGLNFSGTWAGAYRTTYSCDPINGRSTVRIGQTGTRVTLDITEVGGSVSGPPGEASCKISSRDDLSLSAVGSVSGNVIRIEGGDFRPGRLTYTDGTLAGTLQDSGNGTHNYVWQVRPKAGDSPEAPGTTSPQTPEKPTTPGKAQGVTARLAEVPPSNGKKACDTARARVQYLNGEIQKVAGNLKFTPADNDVRLQQLQTRLARLQADLGPAYSAAVLACVRGASAAVPVGNGSATIKHEKSAAKPLGAGATLLPGDTIRTKEASVAKLTLPDRSQVIMNGGASVTLGDRAKGKPFLQSLGEVRYEMKKSMTGAEIRNDRCRDCTATVRGTAFTFAVRGATSVVSTYEGTVAAKSGGRTVLVKKGYRSTLAPGKAPTPPTTFNAPARPFWTPAGGAATAGAVKEFSTTAGPTGVTPVGPTDVCCVDAKIRGSYDATSGRLAVTWALPSGLCFFSVLSGPKLTAGGLIRPAGNLPGRGSGASSFTGDGTYCGRTGFKVRPTLKGTFYVQIVFSCRSIDAPDCDSSFAGKGVYSRPLKIDLSRS